MAASQASLLLQKQLRGPPLLFDPLLGFFLLLLLVLLLWVLFLTDWLKFVFWFLDLCKHPVDGFSAGLVDESNVFEWSVTIIGPPDTL